MKEKLKEVGNHLRENKKLYLTGVACLVVGVVGTLLLVKQSNQISISNPALVNWKPNANTIQVNMVRPGPKSFVVQCHETQQTWPSIHQAAESLGLNPSEISKHLKGERMNVDGLHFAKLAEI